MSHHQHLPNDIARCSGDGEPGDWREGCEQCRRRTDPGDGPNMAHMEPPPIIAFMCPWLIEDDQK